jgi:hypothetical protein
MGWKSVVWVGCLLPVLAGCGGIHNLATEARTVRASRGNHKPWKDAHSAWRTVCDQHPGRAFTNDFRDGFLNGYTESLERGEAAQPTASPPLKYVLTPKYFTPEGRCAVRDYHFGFKCGRDVAGAGGRREIPTGPGLPLGASPPAPPPLGMTPNPLPPRPVPPRKSDDPPPAIRPPFPTSPGPGSSQLPKPELPFNPPFNPDLLGGGKFAPLPVPHDPDLLPVPNPPLPNVPVTPLPVPRDGPPATIPPVLGPQAVPIPVPSMKVPLTAPTGTGGVPGKATGVPLPLVLSDIPVIPFRLALPEPLPVGGRTSQK